MSRRIREVSVDLWLGLALGAGTLALLMATLDEPTITWDEGYTITREDKVRSWFHLLISPEHPLFPGRLFGEPILQLCWPFARQEPDGHPPFYAVLGVAGWLISHAWLPPLEAYRFGPVLLFSFTMGVMYVFVARRWGRLAGVTAAGSWLLMPRIFAHAHFASYDMPLACLWFLSVAAFWKACERWPISFRSGITWSVTFAVVLAMAAATKFTGWLIPLPLLAWSGVQGIARLRREGIASLKWLLLPGVCVVPLLFVAPEVIRLLHKLAHTEAAVLETMPNADPIKWPTMVANEFRAQASGSVPFALAFLPAALWCVAAAWFGFRPSAAARRPGSPLAATWSAAAVLTPPLTVALIPTWWPDPLRGLAIFLWANLTRQKTIAIPTLFFGKTYEFSLPWYNTLAWVFLTVPAITFLIILFGLVATMASLGRVGNGAVPDAGETKDEGQKSFDSSLAWLLLLNALTLLVIRALPNAPGHDGERQMLGCFPFLACMAGIGAEAVRRQIAARVPAVIANLFTVGLVAAALVWAGAAVWHYRPAPLSYYTELVGGLRGACRLGLEPAYYWDALDDKLLDWLNSHTGRDEKVRFCAYFDSQRYLREWGKLRVKMLPHEPGVWRWYVLQNRPGPFVTRPYDRWLAEHGHAAYTKDLDGVPLIWIFPFDEYEQAIRQTKSGEDAAGP